MKRIASLGSLILLVALFAFTMTAGTASAHGHRHVEGYNFVVGFLEEPAYANMKNGLDLTICKGEECQYTVKDGQRVVSNPVEGLEETLKAEVIVSGSEPLPLTLSARFNQPGKYASYFMPTQEGEYTFRIFGTIEGKQIDESFSSIADHFSEITSITSYPADSNSGDNAGNNDNSLLQQQVNDARTAANNAQTFGMIGIAAGVIGLLLAVLSLARRPKVATETAKEPAESLRG